MTKIKSPAQLDREITEALSGRSRRPLHATRSDRAAELIANYGTWTSGYSNEDRDRTVGLANRLTAIDREAGRAAPPVGYSKQRYAQAERVVEGANRYGKKQQSLPTTKSSHARKKKIDPQEAKRLLASDGIDFRRDFHELPSYETQRLADMAKLTGYRKRKDAPGSTARMYFQYLSRLRDHATRNQEVAPGTPSSKIKLPSGQAAAWAHRYFSTANTPAELTELRRVMMNPWIGVGRYFASRTGIAQSEINAVYQQHRARVKD